MPPLPHDRDGAIFAGEHVDDLDRLAVRQLLQRRPSTRRSTCEPSSPPRRNHLLRCDPRDEAARPATSMR
ncbi:MAG: hypothetical protein HRT86_14060 [Ilumatobacteraceae bacterium]|nr:hypothetical protein [Ilumatobacteraceae bacterium]